MGGEGGGGKSAAGQVDVAMNPHAVCADVRLLGHPESTRTCVLFDVDVLPLQDSKPWIAEMLAEVLRPAFSRMTIV
jgi:hypothetical protein